MNKIKPVLVPFCASRKCYSATDTRYGTLKQNIKPGTFNCPDCGHALFWAKQRKNGRASFNHRPEKK